MKLKRLLGIAAGAAAVSGQAMADDRPYELLSATLNGRPTIAIVNHQGTAIAIELDDDAPEIIQGLAAGAILSDLRQVANDSSPAHMQVSSGRALHSEVRVDGAIRVGRASRAETEAVIEGLPHLSVNQRNELRALLSL